MHWFWTLDLTMCLVAKANTFGRTVASTKAAGRPSRILQYKSGDSWTDGRKDRRMDGWIDGCVGQCGPDLVELTADNLYVDTVWIHAHCM